MDRPTLYVNACVRKDSRTEKLAKELLSRLNSPYEEIRLADISFPVVTGEYLNLRDRLLREKAYTHPMFALARQFCRAQTVVIASPYWDLSFPAMLKQYLEQVNVVGITFRYSEDGVPVGLCRAKRLFYVTTAGGNYVPDDYGFGYVKALVQSYYAVPDVRKIEADGLDIVGADVHAIMAEAEETLNAMKLD